MNVELRPVELGDYEYVIPRLDQWWGGRKMSALLPLLFFEHFSPTTAIAIDAGTHGIVGFVCGFVSQTDAPPCTDCGAIMVRRGACYSCLNCGATSGCS